MNKYIYHIASRIEWVNAQKKGVYIVASLENEGFIHCSTRQQVCKVGEQYYHGQPGLVLLCVDAGQVRGEVRYEDSHSNGELFPHIYAPLNIDAVVKAVAFHPQADGTFDWPADAVTE